MKVQSYPDHHTSPTLKRRIPSVRPNPRLRFGLVLGMLFLCLTNATTLFAHDGGFGHSRRLIYVSATPDSFLIEYRLKQGLEEALVELVHVDADRDGKISQAERDQFFTARGKALLANLAFRDASSGKAIAAEFAGFKLQHSLVQVYRLRLASDAQSVLLVDGNFPHKPGQVAIEVDAGLKAGLPEEIDLSHADQVRVTLERTAKGKP
jgi:hypothetical protein